MQTIARRRRGIVVALLLVGLTIGAGPLLAATCAQPVVAFKAGQLSVSSNGCSLQQTLNAISQQTGIEINMPATASTVPVFAVLGPGDPAHVISELLDGSPFNCTLTAKADGSGLMRVVLTDRVAFVPDKPAVGTPAATGRAGASTVGGSMAAASGGAQNSSPAGKKKDDTATVASAADDQSDQPRARPEIDDATLKKLPPLPSNVPVGMWQLYPSIVENGGVVPSGPPMLPNGQPAPPISPSNPAYNGNVVLPTPGLGYDPALATKGVVGLPQLPPDIDPNIARLYPWNLMQLIQSPIQLPNIQFPPMAKPIPNH